MELEQKEHGPPLGRSVPERVLLEYFERAEGLIVSLVALVLIVLALIAVVNAVIQIAQPLRQAEPDFTGAITNGISAAFLVIILTELLHTTLARGGVSRQLQEFLVIGITVGVRHSLELAATKDDATRLAIDLALNASAVLILVGALWLVRQQARADRREAPDDGN